MKYYKTTADDDIDIKCVAGIIINTLTNLHFYIDGVLQQSVDKPYNVYEQDGIEYNIQHNIAVLYTFRYPHLEKLKQSLAKFISAVNLHPMRGKIKGYSRVTTQFTSVEMPITRALNLTVLSEFPTNQSFITNLLEYKLYIINDVTQTSAFYIPFVTKPVSEFYKFLATTTVVMDNARMFSLESGYSSINMPLITDYTKYKENKIYNKPIYIDAIVGIDYELYKLFNSEDTLPVHLNDVDQFLWAEWSELHIDNVPKNNKILSNIDIDIHVDHLLYKGPVCALSGTPIYEDCYVFEISARYDTRYVEVKNVNDTHVVISYVKKTDLQGNSAVVTVPKRKLTSRKRGGQATTAAANQATTNQATTATTNQAANQATTATTNQAANQATAATTNQATQPNNIKPPAAEWANYLAQIKEPIRFDTEVHLLVSPYYYHKCNKSPIIAEFLNSGRYLISQYRTFSPVTRQQVIDSMTEHITPLYKKILTAYNNNFTINTIYTDTKYQIFSLMDNIKYYLTSYPTNNVILNTDERDVVLFNTDEK